jgi:hypothetical protein
MPLLSGDIFLRSGRLSEDRIGAAATVPIVPDIVSDEVVIGAAEEALLVAHAHVVRGRADDLYLVRGLLSVP